MANRPEDTHAYPSIPTPPPPEGLRELLDEALNEHERAHARAIATATLLYRLERWLEGFVAYCEPRGGTLGMDLAALKAVTAAAEQAPEGSRMVVEPRADGSVSIRHVSGKTEDLLDG